MRMLVRGYQGTPTSALYRSGLGVRDSLPATLLAVATLAC